MSEGHSYHLFCALTLSLPCCRLQVVLHKRGLKRAQMAGFHFLSMRAQVAETPFKQFVPLDISDTLKTSIIAEAEQLATEQAKEMLSKLTNGTASTIP
jgi:hypothetical protein